MNTTVIGIEIGGTKLQVVLGRGDGSILERCKFEVNPDRGADGIRLQIESALRTLLAGGSAPTAVGVGFGGPLDRALGKVACSHQIDGWSGFDLQHWLQDLSGLPVALDNDANVAALGEAIKGAGIGFNPVFYITLGSGVGGGAVVDNAIYHGATPGESEIGHLRLDRNGRIVEEVCSGWAMDRRIREAVSAHPESLLAKVVGDRIRNEAVVLHQALDRGCPVAQTLLNETAASLAFALSHVTHLMHPEAIILGGGLSLMGEVLRSAVSEALPSWLMEVFRPGPQIKLATLKEDAVPVGALLMAGQCHRKGANT